MGQAISRRLDGIPTTEVAIRVIQPPGGPLRPKPASRTRAVCVGARADDGGLPFSVGAAAGQPHTDIRDYGAGGHDRNKKEEGRVGEGRGRRGSDGGGQSTKKKK